MVNSPLSTLPHELRSYIVDFVANSNEDLCNLALSDRAFTQLCQAHIFRTLELTSDFESWDSLSLWESKLDKIRKIFEDKPSLVDRVRAVKFGLWRDGSWHFENDIFLSILQLLAKSPRAPHILYMRATMDCLTGAKVLSNSFFSQTLTTLHLDNWYNVPLSLVLAFPNLKKLFLDDVAASEEYHHAYPNTPPFCQELPAIEIFKYRKAQKLIHEMIPHAIRALWSNLRFIMLSPREQDELDSLQPILDATCETLEELHIIEPVTIYGGDQPVFAEYVDLSKHSCLRVFALEAIVRLNTHIEVLYDINIVLSTIPASNSVTNLSFAFETFAGLLFGGSLDEDWACFCNEVIRISAGKHLELELKIVVTTERPGKDQLYADIKKQTRPLNGHSNIHLYYWKADSLHGFDRYLHAQARRKREL